MLANGGWDLIRRLTLILLTWTIWRAPTKASKWRMEFNSAFKGLNLLKRHRNIFRCRKKKKEPRHTDHVRHILATLMRVIPLNLVFVLNYLIYYLVFDI